MGNMSNISVMIALGKLTSEYLLFKYDVEDSEKYLISTIYRYICDQGIINKGSLYEYACNINPELEEFYEKLKSFLNDNKVSYDNIKSFFVPENEYTIGNEFILDILRIRESEGGAIYQEGTGVGNFLSAASLNNDKLIPYGNDEDRENSLIAAMALSIMTKKDCSENIVNTSYISAHNTPKFDYAFANMFNPTKRITESNVYRIWRVIEKIVNTSGKEKFRCAFIVGKEVLELYSSPTHRIFSRLVSEGFLEGVIEHRADNDEIPSYLLVFSRGYGSNGKIKVAGKETWEKSGYSDDGFLDRYFNDSDILQFESEIFSGFNNINPDNLSDDMPENGFKTVGSLFDVIQGTQYTRGRFLLDETGESNYCIISPSDIDNIVWSDLKRVELEENSRYDETLIHKGDVIVTSRYTDFKCVYISEEPIFKTIPSGGMVILRLKKEKAGEFDPLYLNLFLISKTGRDELNKIEKGEVFHYFTLRDLKNMHLPDASIAEQNMKCAEYQALLELKKLFYGKYREVEKQLDEYKNKEM